MQKNTPSEISSGRGYVKYVKYLTGVFLLQPAESLFCQR